VSNWTLSSRPHLKRKKKRPKHSPRKRKNGGTPVGNLGRNSFKEGAMWQKDSSLDNDYEMNIQQPLLSNGLANKHVCMATIENSNRSVFSVRFVPRCYKHDSWNNGLVVSRCQSVRTWARKQRALLGSVTRQRLVKTANWEDFMCAVVTMILGVCNSVRLP
jgi:hypothetical protein